MINIKGTGPPTLCRSCSYSIVIEDGTEKPRVYCTELGWNGPQLLDFPVVKCSRYVDSNVIHKRDLIEIAWILDPNRRKIGFETEAFVKPGTDEHEKLVRKGDI